MQIAYLQCCFHSSFLIPCAYIIQYLNNMMLLGDVLLCPPVARVPREKALCWVCRLRQTTQVEHGEVAFATAMCPPIDSDGERPACCRSKMRNTRKEQIISA